MKRVAKKMIIVLFVITLLFSIFGTISKIFIRKNLNIATLDESNNLAIYPDNTYYNCIDLGSGVEKIHFYNDTTNYGWCMDKGANLYGYGYSGGWGHVSGVSDAYTTNNSRDGYSGSIQWLIDNILRFGDDVSEDETEWYRDNLQRILGSSAQISSYSDDQIFKMQQFALWHFTDNVTGDAGISYPTSDPLYNALYKTAEEKKDYTTSTNKVIVDLSNAVLNSNGIVGPFSVSNNNVMSLTAKLNGTDTKIYTNAECTQELSKYNDYNGDVYIKVTDINNVNIVISWSSFNTTAKYYTTEGNPGSDRDQSFLMIERTKNEDFLTFSKEITGEFNFKLIKEDNAGNKLDGAQFKITIEDEVGNILHKTEDGKTETTTNGELNITELKIENENKTYKITIHEEKSPDGYTAAADKVITAKAKLNGSTYVLEDDKTQTDVIIENSTVTATMKNIPTTGSFEIDLIKYVKGTTIPLAGAEFTVSVKDGTKELTDTSKKYTTGSNGHFTQKVTGLNLDKEGKIYTITVTETKVPEGYEGISGPITFNVTSKLSGDGKSYVLTAGTPTTATNAKKVTVTEGQVLIEAENKPEGPHKGVKEVYNQDSGYDKDEVQDWVITSRVPSGIDKYSTYIITDPIDERLVFSGIENVNVVLLDGKTLEEKETLIAYEDYEVNYDEETRTLKVSFIEDDFKAGQKLKAGSIVEIRFNTTFALDKEGNIIALNQSVPNQATLEYDNNNKLYTEKPEVHTGGVGLYKYDKNTGKVLEGAKFKIATSKENAENGIFVKDANGKDIEKVTNEKGIAVFEGLEFGEDAMDDAKYQTGENIYGKPVYKYDWEKVQTTYYIVETESPTGYSKIEEPIEAVVKKDNYDITDIETLIKVGNESNIYDLALRKFITAVKDGSTGEVEKVTTRIPDVDIANLVDGTSTTATYTHSKNPVLVHTTDTVTYTIRIFNEGPQDAYASLIKDDIPEGLQFVQYTQGDGSINEKYRWKLVDENDNEVTDVSKAKYIITDYLAMDESESNLIKGFNPETMTELDYRDVQVQFKVVEPTTSDRILINYAQISEETDRNGNKVTDRDSTPNEWKGEDDEDIEKVRVLYFDLALRKWVTQAIVTENGQTTVHETGHKAEDDPEEVVKVDLKKSKLNNVTVKFRYAIRVTNEGEIAGEATEIRDDIPKGLKFVAEDNPDWREEDGKIVTNKLANTTLQPGESAEVEILLTWINSEDNMGVMVNTAEINKDHNVYGTPDIDSTPGNNVPGEDDIDDAPVMLTIATGSEVIAYTTLGLGVVAIIGVGVVLIKKRVLITE